MFDRAPDARPAGAPLRLLLTCEHGGNEIPESLLDRFAGHRELLAGHRGWDVGALGLTAELAEGLAPYLLGPAITATTSRLVVDLNRSPWHRRVFSEVTRALPAAERRALVATYHRPYRQEVRNSISQTLGTGLRVLHLGVHSFTPTWQGKPRGTAIGLLYDPGREAERALVARWTASLRRALDARGLTVHRNRPYLGTSDGLTTTLRREFPDPCYLGIELEMSQRLWHPETGWGELGAVLVETLGDILTT